MSHRKQQVESALRRAISTVLAQKLSDPRIRGLVSVTGVDVSPDLRNANVLVSVMPEEFEKRTIAGLRHAAIHIHALVCKAVDMRIVPHLEFKLDKTLKREAGVLAAIHRAMARETPAGAAAPDETTQPADPTAPKPRRTVKKRRAATSEE